MPADDRCPFLKRQKQDAEAARNAFGDAPREVVIAADFAPKRQAAEPVVVQSRPAAADEAGARHWQQHKIVSPDSPYAPHPAWHGKEHRHLPHGSHEHHEYGEE
ncbi:Uncharacterised protein [Burkholderia gladioli]|nr:Uncharacterised protein [Burkholderia gladioli]